MSTGEHRDLRELIDGALAAIEPSPAPVSAVREKGKTMRTRRRLRIGAGLATGLAALAAGLLVVPGLLHQPGHPLPASPRPAKPTVTVHPRGPNSPPGEIAWGTANGKRWQIMVTRSGKISAAGLGSANTGWNPRQGFGPAALGGFTALSGAAVVYGPVRSDVVAVSLALDSGAVLRLHPAEEFGHRLVGVVIPPHVLVTRVTAFSGRGELAYAIPFTGSHGMIGWYSWLRPGEPVPPRVTGTVFAGDVAGVRHTVTVHLGPWGLCLTDPGGPSYCGPRGPQPGTGTLLSTGPGQPGLAVGELRASVTAMLLTMSDGRSVSVPLIPVGGLKFYAVVVTTHPRIRSWATFGAGGSQISAGSGNPFQ
jgi:hypothetical protein